MLVRGPVNRSTEMQGPSETTSIDDTNGVSAVNDPRAGVIRAVDAGE
jgi:hypothetical protein